MKFPSNSLLKAIAHPIAIVYVTSLMKDTRIFRHNERFGAFLQFQINPVYIEYITEINSFPLFQKKTDRIKCTTENLPFPFISRILTLSRSISYIFSRCRRDRDRLDIFSSCRQSLLLAPTRARIFTIIPGGDTNQSN